MRWGSEASKKNKTYLVQSAFLWCQFYETQLLVHRNIALGDLADPERAAASVIICKNAAKCCIEIVESTSDVLDALLYSYLLTVRRASPTIRTLLRYILPSIEVRFRIIHFSCLDVPEEGRVRSRFAGVPRYRSKQDGDEENFRKVNMVK